MGSCILDCGKQDGGLICPAEVLPADFRDASATAKSLEDEDIRDDEKEL